MMSITRAGTYLAPAVLALLLIFCGITAAISAADAPQAGDTRQNPRDGAVMVWVPAGEFTMGTSDEQIQALLRERADAKPAWFADETPQHTVKLEGYWMYKYEVTVAQYRRFCTATKRQMPELPAWAVDNVPVVNVTWYDAVAYAEWAGARLPSEAEWEKAARGVDSRRFPWGNTWDAECCNNYADHQDIGGGFRGTQAAPVGSYPKSVSPYGAEDMAGNVWEWCQDYYAKDYYARSPRENPAGPNDGEMRVLRGGSWGSSSKSLGVAGRNAEQPDLTYHDDGGFRCVVPAQVAY